MKKILFWAFGIFCILIVLLILFALRFYLFGNHAKLDNAVSADWLPKEATNIFARNKGGYEAYEFNIGESEFLVWAKEKGLKVTPIKGESIKVPRYYQSDKRAVEPKDCFSGYGEQLTDVEAEAVMACINDNSGIKIAKTGYHGGNRTSNGGGYSVIFEADKNKVYYSWSSH